MPDVTLNVRRLPLRLTGDARRTIMIFFWPGSAERARALIDRVMGLDDAQVAALLDATLAEFGDRHPDVRSVLSDHCDQAWQRTAVSDAPPADAVTEHRRVLMGAYFTMEYAFESAALFNPSMVSARDQSGLEAGAVRFVMSLRAVGEGHVSSIVFRRGVIDAAGDVRIDPVSLRTRQLELVENRVFEKNTFRLKLIEMGGYTDDADTLLGELDETFTCQQLTVVVERTACGPDQPATLRETGERMMWLARSNYQLKIPEQMDESQLIIFPRSEAESRGMEDMRLVRFVDDDGSVRYYGTYTAFSGAQILPQIIESADERTIEVHALRGRFAQNKGLALFPRKIDGRFAMLARIDGENLYYVRSDNVRFWNDGNLLQVPRQPWEFVQIGNCGSPIETDRGWLVLTHGVGPMRRYCMGAMLLDADDPGIVLGQLDEPLMVPQPDERSGYVPNVVYSCGAMVHNGTLHIPYGISDAATGFATVPLDELLAALRPTDKPTTSK